MAPIPTSQKRPFIPAPGIVQAEMVYRCNGQVCENVYHFQLHPDAAVPTLGEMDTLATRLEGWEHTDMVGARHNQTILTRITIRDLTTESSPAIDHIPTTTVTGTDTGNNVPNNVTAAVKWSTPLRGRSFRGRTYHIGLPSSGFGGNQLTTVYPTTLKLKYARLFDGTSTVAAGELVVLSYASHKFWRDVALATFVVGNSVDPNLDSQRRRLTGRGQ